MEDRRLPSTSETAEHGGRRAVEAAHDFAVRARSAVGPHAERLAGRAQRLAQDAGAGLARVAGPRLTEWTAPVRRLVRDRPLRAVALMLAAGYVLGKLTRRG